MCPQSSRPEGGYVVDIGLLGLTFRPKFEELLVLIRWLGHAIEVVLQVVAQVADHVLLHGQALLRDFESRRVQAPAISDPKFAIPITREE